LGLFVSCLKYVSVPGPGIIIALPKSLLTWMHVFEKKTKPLHPEVVEQFDAHAFAVVLVES
jgi:hypothetical protein